jgi:hypothetical protein
MIAFYIMTAAVIAVGLGFAAGVIYSSRKSPADPFEDQTVSPWTTPSQMPTNVEVENPSVGDEIARYIQIPDEEPVIINGRHRRQVQHYLNERNRESMNAIGRSVG